MADRPIIAPNHYMPIISAGDMSNTITGPATIIQRLPGISYDIAWTGNPVGTFEVQVSNTYQIDSQGNVLNAGNWTTIPSSTFTGTYPAPAGGSDNGFIDVVGTEAYAVRLVYVAASGTGSLTVVCAAKVL